MIRLLLSLFLLGGLLYAENPQTPPTYPPEPVPIGPSGMFGPTGPRDHGLRRLPPLPGSPPGVTTYRPVTQQACPAASTADIDGDFLQKLAGVLISPSHFHAGTSAMVREFLRDAASRDKSLAGRVFDTAIKAYDQSFIDFPGAESGELLQLVGEMTPFLPDNHPAKRPGVLAQSMKDHALKWLDSTIDSEVRKTKKKLTDATKIPPSLLNVVAGYAKTLDSLDPEAREEWLNSFLVDVEKRGLGEAESYLLQPLARHFGERQVTALFTKWKESPTSPPILSMLSTALRNSPNPKVARIAEAVILANNSETMEKLKASVGERMQVQRKEIQRSSDDLKKLNVEILELSIQMGLDIAGLVDPSPLCSALGAGYCLYREMKSGDPDFMSVTLSLIGILPVLGKAGLGAKWAHETQKLVSLTYKAKAALEGIMQARRMLQQSYQAKDFVDYGLALGTQVAQKELGKKLNENRYTAGLSLERFVGLPLADPTHEPVAIEMAGELANRFTGGKIKETCSAFDKQMHGLKSFFLLPQKAVRKFLGGQEQIIVNLPKLNKGIAGNEQWLMEKIMNAPLKKR